MGVAVRARCGGDLATAVIEERRLVAFMPGCEVIL